MAYPWDEKEKKRLEQMEAKEDTYPWKRGRSAKTNKTKQRGTKPRKKQKRRA